MSLGMREFTQDEAAIDKIQLSLLKSGYIEQDNQQITSTPIFTHRALKKHPEPFTQYGFLAGNTTAMENTAQDDPRLYFNISAPSSVFICGSQGSGKSHTLSCLLENCMAKSAVSKLEHPLAGLVLHYDTFASDIEGMPCEAAYLSSDPAIKVRILCSPTNIETIKRTYRNLNVQIESLKIDQKDLNTQRMLDLMAVSTENGPMPLYLHSINRILRKLRIEQQAKGVNTHFNYSTFKRMVEDLQDLTPAQKAPLNQRLDTLESFMDAGQISVRGQQLGKKKNMAVLAQGNDWSLKAGMITIVDLSCPCVTAEAACALFNICLGIFMGQKEQIGRVIALDEAHKYMNDGIEANTLTNALLSAIRLQRHLGTRVLISTQEPTISPKLLDLCSATIVHRFTSPEWLQCLKAHIAALDGVLDENGKSDMKTVLHKIVNLRVGEALLFSPSATVNDNGGRMKRLGMDYLKIRVRSRLTADGGKSQMAE